MVKRLFTAILLSIVGTYAMAHSPNDVIQAAADQFQAELSGNKEALAADKERLYALVDDILLPRFDRRYAAQLVLGKHWKTASEEQRESFINAFYGSLLRRYSDGVLEFDPDRVEILPFRGDESKKRTTVRTIVRLEDDTKVPVNYGMVRREDGWLMFDVSIEGISYIRNFRTEINSEIRTKGLDAVIARLQSRLADKE